MEAVPKRFDDIRLLLGVAAAFALGMCLVAALAGLFDSEPLTYAFAALSGLGLGWVPPGVLVGLAAAIGARNRGKAHATRRGVVVGIVTAITVLFVAAFVADVAGVDLDELSS